MTEVSPLSSPINTESSGKTDAFSDDMMLSDAGYSRGDIEISTESGSGEGSGTDEDEFTLFTDTDTSKFESTFEGSGTSSDDNTETTVSGITESPVSGTTEFAVTGTTASAVTGLSTEFGATDESGEKFEKLILKACENQF